MLDPLEESLDLGFAVGQSMRLFGLTRELAFAELGFDVINGLDMLECFSDAGGLGVLGFKEGAARMCPALGMRQSGLLGITLVSGVAVTDEHGIGLMLES